MADAKKVVAILEDDQSMRFFYEEVLEPYQLVFFQCLSELDQYASKHGHQVPDLLIADAMLPDGHFLDRIISAPKEWPVLKWKTAVVSADVDLGAHADLVRTGRIDVLLEKSTDKRLLLANLAKLLGSSEGKSDDNPLVYCTVGCIAKSSEGASEKLTPIEGKVLTLLLREMGRRWDSTKLMQEVWTEGADQRNFANCVSRLRSKLRPTGFDIKRSAGTVSLARSVGAKRNVS